MDEPKLKDRDKKAACAGPHVDAFDCPIHDPRKFNLDGSPRLAASPVVQSEPFKQLIELVKPQLDELVPIVVPSRESTLPELEKVRRIGITTYMGGDGDDVKFVDYVLASDYDRALTAARAQVAKLESDAARLEKTAAKAFQELLRLGDENKHLAAQVALLQQQEPAAKAGTAVGFEKVRRYTSVWHSLGGPVSKMYEHSTGEYVLASEYDSLYAAYKALLSAIQWALGESGDFPRRMGNDDMFWWRKELRKRAALAVPPYAPPEKETEPSEC